MLEWKSTKNQRQVIAHRPVAW